MNKSRSARGQTYAEVASELCMRASSHSRQFLVRDLYELDATSGALKGAEHAIDPVAWKAIHAPYSPRRQALNDGVADRSCQLVFSTPRSFRTIHRHGRLPLRMQFRFV